MEPHGVHHPTLLSQFPSYTPCMASPPAQSLSERATVLLLYYGPHKELKRLVRECSREDVIHDSDRVTFSLSQSPR